MTANIIVFQIFFLYEFKYYHFVPPRLTMRMEDFFLTDNKKNIYIPTDGIK